MAGCIIHITLLLETISEEEKISKIDAIGETVRESPMTFVILVYNFILVWFVFGLSTYHCYLTCTNQTTNEQLRHQYSRGDNPYHRGGCSNFKLVFCSPMTKSLVRATEPADIPNINELGV